ncbi:MAG: CopD family protein [Crocinitomicaceae bacterium]
MSPLYAIKALHVIFIVTWFAGLFYGVRLFVYLAEAKEKPQNEREILVPQYQLMLKRLWYGIAWPSMILATTFGAWMVVDNPGILQVGYMQVKFAFVGGLIIYHLVCHSFFSKLIAGSDSRSGNFYRIWNEFATLFLVAIIFIIMMRDALNWIYGLLGFLAFAIALMLAIKIYKRIREK